MAQYDRGYLSKDRRDAIEKSYKDEKRKQQGITFPSAGKQEHVFIIRFDIADNVFKDKSQQSQYCKKWFEKTMRTI